MSTIISIDPGVTGTGIAAWSFRDWRACVNPLWCKNLYPKCEDADWEARARNLTLQVHALLLAAGCNQVYMEKPSFHDDFGGHLTARRGDLVKLVFLAGAYAGLCWEMNIKLDMYTPLQWKGQLSKQVVEQRIKQRLPDIHLLNPKSHSYDAIGIGLHAKGFL